MVSPLQSPISVGIFHPTLAVAGSESIAMWAAQGLLEQGYQVTVIGPPGADLSILDAAFGTNVVGLGGQYKPVPLPAQLVRKLQKVSRLWFPIFGHFAAKMAVQYDIQVSGYNFIPFKKPGIQLIGDFSFDPTFASNLDSRNPHKEGFPAFAKRLAKHCADKLLSIPNPLKRSELGDEIIIISKWMQSVMQERYELFTSHLAYPVVLVPDPIQTELEARSPLHFVNLGRIVPEKRIESVITILEGVRKRGFNVTLEIIGHFDDSNYCRGLLQKVEDSNGWITAPGQLVGEEKTAALKRATFGIHGRLRESFGVAVAEIAEAGAIPFVPSEGGQFEIVDYSPELGFQDEADGIEKICAVLSNPDIQIELREKLQASVERFQDKYFTAAVCQSVERLLATREVSVAEPHLTTRPRLIT